MNKMRLTALAFKYLCRLGKYIVETKDLCLTLAAPIGPHGVLDLFSVYADSSHGNAKNGRSYGGFVLLCEDRRRRVAGPSRGKWRRHQTLTTARPAQNSRW